MRILIVLSRVPYPLEKGDKLRAYHQIKHLSKNNELILCCINDAPLHPQALDELKPYCKEIHIVSISRFAIIINLVKAVFSNKPMQVAYFYHKKGQKTIDLLIEKHAPKRIYCQLIRVAEYVKKYTIIPKTLDYMDAFSEGMSRRVKGASFFMKPIFNMEAKRLKQYETIIFDKFEQKTIISEQDRRYINHPQRNQIHVVANGIDSSFFTSQRKQKNYELLFCGNMSYPPNIESAIFIAKQILPLVAVEFPTIKLYIAGANPHPSVRALSSKHVIVSGWIPDIRMAYDESSIFIAPMQTGTGLQNKLLEAMAMGLPCITSKLANNALKAVPNLEILIGETREQYATLIISLLKNSGEYSKIAKRGQEFVKSTFNWEKSTLLLEEIIRENKK